MLINILCLIIGVALTLVWIKVVNRKTPLNFQEIVKDKFWLIITGSLIVAIGYLYFYLPQVFKWLATDVWGVPNSTIAEDGKTKVLQLTDLGPLGDIYGSLNTLFTSATLAFVVYATLLQRQANNDAREAMAKQLRQARHATRKQLRQAQLSTKRQLILAQATHDAQMKESKYSIFSNVFYALLNQKHSRYLSLQTKKGGSIYSAQEIFSHVNLRLTSHLINKWKDISSLSAEDVKKDFFSTMYEISNVNNHSELFSYFRSIIDLYELVNRSGLDEVEKVFFKRLISNSISGGENAALFWLGVFRKDVINLLKNERVFSIGYDDFIMPFVVKFYTRNCFHNENIRDKWEQYAKE